MLSATVTGVVEVSAYAMSLAVPAPEPQTTPIFAPAAPGAVPDAAYLTNPNSPLDVVSVLSTVDPSTWELTASFPLLLRFIVNVKPTFSRHVTLLASKYNCDAEEDVRSRIAPTSFIPKTVAL
jgi:hypothetical protein